VFQTVAAGPDGTRMSLLPVVAVVAVWAIFVGARWRRAASTRRVRRQWEQAVATLDALAADRGAGPGAGQVWCRTVEHLLPAPGELPLLPVQRTSPEPVAPDLVAAS
jgi:hypothetical protein